MLLQVAEILQAHLPGRMLAYAFEHVLHGHIATLPTPGKDGAAIDEHAGHIEPQHGHHHARQRLVAPGDADQGVIGMAAHGQLDRVGDDLAADQRRAHALVPHGDTVRDGDGAELAGRAAG